MLLVGLQDKASPLNSLPFACFQKFGAPILGVTKPRIIMYLGPFWGVPKNNRFGSILGPFVYGNPEFRSTAAFSSSLEESGLTSASWPAKPCSCAGTAAWVAVKELKPVTPLYTPIINKHIVFNNSLWLYYNKNEKGTIEIRLP